MSSSGFLFLVVSFVLATLADSQACTQQWQCVVGSDYNYVGCINGQCQCRSDLGFTGTPSTGCVCNSPATVNWIGSTPYCVDIAGTARGTLCMQKVQTVYTNIIYPTPLFILNNTLSTSNLFVPNVGGRVDPFGPFINGSLVDYYYAFAVSFGVRVISVNFRSLTWNPADSTAAVRVDLLFALVIGGAVIPFQNVTESGIYRFNENNLITAADLIVHNPGFQSNAFLANRTAYHILTCSTYFSSCTLADDPTGYYGTFQNCINFLSGNSYLDVHGNSVTNNLLRTSALAFGGGPGVGPTSYDQPSGNTDT